MDKKKKPGETYVVLPRSTTEMQNNVLFQINGLIEWLETPSIEKALIKAKCLKLDILELFEKINNEKDGRGKS